LSRPWSDGDPASGQPEPKETACALPIRVLVAEDSEDDALLLMRQLRRSGFDPRHDRVASPGALAAALDRGEWDVLITDYNMPQFSPDDVLTAVRERGVDVPIILVSAHVADARAADAMKAGIHDYVLKDNLSRLGPAIQRELREAANRRAQRDAEAEVERLSSQDPLTGLPNRRQLETALERALGVSERVAHAFLYLDLDRFRVINDTCGHDGGDELIRGLAGVLDGFLRDRDVLARIGPDEFGVLLEACPMPRAWRIAEQMHRAVNGYRFEWGGEIWTPGVSIGVVPLDGPGASVADVLRRADLACHTAKELGRNRIRLYSEEDADLTRRHGDMQWVARLHRALDRGSFRLDRQPMRRLGEAASGPLLNELLVRLVEEDGEVVAPGRFIPAAEHYALMPLIDRWVIARAFRWIGAESGATAWFINLSGTSLSDESLPEYVHGQLTTHGVEPARVCFEITETAAITNMQAASRFMTHVRELGCAVALDDFGSGLSSFNYLKTLPADYLKLDGQFVRGMATSGLDRTIVDAVTRVGHAAGMQVIAEHAETPQALEALAQRGVDFAQGYAVAAPRPLEGAGDDGPRGPGSPGPSGEA
jgi:diguanylate cyclase (GGDEF)-like protein